MAVNQVKIRRDNRTNLFAATPADGELAYDTTNKRLSVGDGSGVYGTPVASIVDSQNQRFNAIDDTSASADAIEIDFATELAPATYAAYQRFAFIAANTNTGTTTLEVNGLGTKIIKKVVSDAKAILAAGDITSGLLYEVMYDGTDFVLTSKASLDAAVSGDYAEDYDEVLSTKQSVTTTYTKVHEHIAGRSGTYNVIIRSNGSASGAHYLRIYVNGAAEGTQRYEASGTTTWEEDITVVRGDLIQLYARGSIQTVDIAAATFSICSDNPVHTAIHKDYASLRLT